MSLLHVDCNFNWKNLKAGDDSMTGPCNHLKSHSLQGLAVDVA